jgi:phosphoinositide-3-kinase regulatory subunit 4
MHTTVEKEALADIANVYNYQMFVETEKAGYIIRQWIASNLYDRIRYIHSTFILC